MERLRWETSTVLFRFSPPGAVLILPVLRPSVEALMEGGIKGESLLPEVENTSWRSPRPYIRKTLLASFVDELGQSSKCGRDCPSSYSQFKMDCPVANMHEGISNVIEYPASQAHIQSPVIFANSMNSAVSINEKYYFKLKNRV